MKVTLRKDLEAARASAAERINAGAGAAMALIRTPGMEDVYAAKLAQARALIVAGDGAVTEADYPDLAADLRPGLTLTAIAGAVIAAAARWDAARPMIERRRQAALHAVRVATTEAAIEAATNVNWSVDT